MTFRHLKIGARLTAAFALIFFLLAAILGTALWQLKRVGEAKAVMADANRKEKLAEKWLAEIEANSLRAVARIESTDPVIEQRYEADMKNGSARMSTAQKELESLVRSEKGKLLLQSVADTRTAYIAIRTDAFKRKAELQATGQMNALLADKLKPALTAYLAAVNEVVAFQSSLFSAAEKSIDEVRVDSEKLLIALGLIGLIVGVAAGVLLTRSITRPLARAVRLAEQVASGDLTTDIQITSKDEVGALQAALKRMNESLLKTVSEVRAGTETIVTASQQIAAGNLDLSSRTEQQASSLEETASSMEELTGTVRQNADNARQANALAQSASEVATRGGDVVSQVVVTMASINESSKKIADIIAVIDGIAFQTNILALNAAVEAARAGEQGRGFAVVASEVRNLAQRSAGAAKEIRSLIIDSVSKVETGGLLVEQAGATMEEIVQGITRVTDIMSEIASASAEQTVGIEQVNSAITQMDAVTQQNAALVEEAAAAAESLQDQAASLAQLVSTFKVDSKVSSARQQLGIQESKYAASQRQLALK